MGLLYLVGKGACYYFLCFCTVIHFVYSLFSVSIFLALLSLYLLSLGHSTKSPTKTDMSVNKNSYKNQSTDSTSGSIFSECRLRKWL